MTMLIAFRAEEVAHGEVVRPDPERGASEVTTSGSEVATPSTMTPTKLSVSPRELDRALRRQPEDRSRNGHDHRSDEEDPGSLSQAPPRPPRRRPAPLPLHRPPPSCVSESRGSPRGRS